MKTGTPPKATIETKSPDRTVWLVQWPSTRKAYYATTFPDSDQLRLETRTKRLAVGPEKAKRITATVRRAIAQAAAGLN